MVYDINITIAGEFFTLFFQNQIQKKVKMEGRILRLQKTYSQDFFIF